MTLYVNIGRRLPRNWVKRQMGKIGGLLTFQENIWLMIYQSLSLAKKKAKEANNGLVFTMTKEHEIEDLHYQLEWLRITITGTKEQELEEYNDTMKLYDPFGKILKDKFKDSVKDADPNMKKHFKTKILNSKQVENAYEKGYGSVSDNNISNKLLEMGILTHCELKEDYNMRN